MGNTAKICRLGLFQDSDFAGDLEDSQSTSGAQVTAERAISNLATAQVRKDTPSLIDLKGLGSPKEFAGREDNSGRRRRRHFLLV